MFQMCLALSVPDRRSSHQPETALKQMKQGDKGNLLNQCIIASSAAVLYLFDDRLTICKTEKDTNHTTMQYTIRTPIHTGPKRGNNTTPPPHFMIRDRPLTKFTQEKGYAKYPVFHIIIRATCTFPPQITVPPLMCEN